MYESSYLQKQTHDLTTTARQTKQAATTESSTHRITRRLKGNENVQEKEIVGGKGNGNVKGNTDNFLNREKLKFHFSTEKLVTIKTL